MAVTGDDGATAVPFSAFMEEALYAPGTGFYERGGQAGRSRGDFVTSPEVGPLFGAVLARALDAWWEEQGRPDPFFVDEHGAGPGTLARTVLVAAPACAPALRWTLVERAAAQRALHPAHLPHVGDASSVGAGWAGRGGGPLAASTATAPARPAHVALANELLDNLPFDLFEWGEDGWSEVWVTTGVGGDVAEALVPADPDDAVVLSELAPDAAGGARVPLQRQAGEWVADRLAGLAPGGRLVVIDYGATTADLAARPVTEWLRTYRDHGRGRSQLEDAGGQDITVEVCVDQLGRFARPPDEDRDQATFLRVWGVDDLVVEGQRIWSERPGPPDLAALRAHSRAAEAEALCDPAGLGAFRALGWHVSA